MCLAQEEDVDLASVFRAMPGAAGSAGRAGGGTGTPADPGKLLANKANKGDEIAKITWPVLAPLANRRTLHSIHRNLLRSRLLRPHVRRVSFVLQAVVVNEFAVEHQGLIDLHRPRRGVSLSSLIVISTSRFL